MTNIGSIHDSANICAIENILTSPVHLVHTPTTLPTSPIFNYGRESYPLSPSHDSSEESVTPKGNPKPHDNPSNPVPNVLADPDSDPSLSDFSSSNSSDSPDNKYYKQR